MKIVMHHPLVKPFRRDTEYHPDPLGSTSYLTDRTGEVYQHVEYFPFGSIMVEERHWTVNNQYLFNGKELDQETGLYYYGARYYDPRTSIFISVDPLAEKAPFASPYRYGFNNPLRYIDPNGMFEDEASAQQYQEDNNIQGTISQGTDGLWSINDTENGVSYFKDRSLDKFDNVIGRGADGVIKSATVTGQGSSAQSQQGSANVYIETSGIGHAYIEVNGIVFSYGRYNGTYSPSSGAFGPVGDGVLYKKTGDAATEFIAARTSLFLTKKYSFNVNTTATYNYFNNAYNAGTYNTRDSRVIDTYYLLGNNCTVIVCSGLRAGGSGIPIIQTPAGFVSFMYNVNRMQNGWNPGAVVPWEPKY